MGGYMARSLGASRLRSLAFLGVVVYAVILMAGAFEHHELLCELKTPQHCTACAANQLGSDPPTPTLPGRRQLTDAGRAVSIDLDADGTVLTTRRTGRSPPAHS